MLHSIPFGPNGFTCQCSLQWVVGQVQEHWLLAHHQYWTPTETPLKCPAATLSHGDPVAIFLQDQFLHTL